ncbi:MAG: hypothetical protein Q4D85_11270 [Corynebacterium sp.]|nr:hypothetical protein [Corynebacterium sp.]
MKIIRKARIYQGCLTKDWIVRFLQHYPEVKKTDTVGALQMKSHTEALHFAHTWVKSGEQP